MGTLFVTEFVSTDGVMEAPGGEEGFAHTGWTMDFSDPEMYAYKAQETNESDALLLGRKTYEGFSEAWPEREGEFADKFNNMPKYVVSSTLADPGWNNTTVIGSDPATDVAKLKDDVDGAIQVAGSATLVHALYDAGLVDEWRLMTFPTVLGGGLKVFPESGTRRDLQLAETRSYDSGVELRILRPA